MPSLSCAAGLSSAQERGRRIYHEGKGRNKISAVLLGPGIKAPGRSFPCVNCHLGEGSGDFEGGVRSAEINYWTLTKEFSGPRPSGRIHPPYSDEDLFTAVTSGMDPAGNDLDPAHPRYEMEQEDLEDLLAYIKVLGREPVPGVTDDQVRVGMLLPGSGPLAEAGREMRALLEGIFADVNERGALYRRALTLVPASFDPSKEGDDLTAARDLLKRRDVFCFLANLAVPTDGDVAKFLAEEKVPVIAPLLAAPEGGFGTDRYTFHILSSVRDQARVMADFLAEDLKMAGKPVGILHAADRHGEGGATGVREQARRHGLKIVAEFQFVPGKLSPPEAVSRLRKEGAEAIFYFGGGREALAFAREAGRQGWSPVLMAPAQLVGNTLFSVPEQVLGGVYLAVPFTPPRPDSRGMADLLRIGEKHGVARKHLAFQVVVYAGAKLLEDGLKRAGVSVTRENFVDTIGNLWKYETHLTPPLTYTPNRRAGAAGAAMIRVDKTSRKPVAAAPWREPK
jgi:ABC-type branched-subunit amino acid transport system substrate-binding protein